MSDTNEGLGDTTDAAFDETLGSEAGVASRTRHRLGVGSLVGRYVTLSELGSGGMGVVFAAYDPQLDRKLAIKLLKTPGDLGGARARLQREAQALAKLDHRNVVSVHDVGVHEGQLFVAMEFVAGKTLDVWMTELGSPRPWREVLAVFIEAGRGLAAAHEAGLIHRDFKPGNVMLGDAPSSERGRVRVMDFGLVRSDPSERDPGGETLSLEARINQLTPTNAVMGTAPYMPLEQFEAADVDARSDQFSFCVSLYEALYGERPFAGETVGELVLSLDDEAIREPPANSSVPPWLRKVIVKGLAKDRAQRWPSMAALLDALADDPAPRRRRWAAAGMVVALLGGATWGVAELIQDDARYCRGAEAKLAGVWDEQRRAAVEQAILATEPSYAPDTWTLVEQHLDAYAEAWVAARVEACEATHHGEQSSELLDLRMACLDDRLEHLRVTVDELAQADTRVVERAVQAVLALPTLDRCADVEALRAAVPPPDDPVVAERVAALGDRLATARAKEQAGKYDEALELVNAVVAEAATIDYGPLWARAWLTRAAIERQKGEYEQAEATLEQALHAAVAQRMPDEAASAAVELVNVVGYRQGRHEAGRDWAAHADSLSRAAGTSEARAAHFNNLGLLAQAEGKYAEAGDHHERALFIREQALGPDHPAVAISLNNLGIVADNQGDYPRARGHHERALRIRERSLGPDHPLVASSLANLASVAQAEGELAQARSHYTRARAILEGALGPRHPDVAIILYSLGILLASEGKPAEARDHHERALSIWESELGPEHPDVADALSALGVLAANEGELETARSYHERALSIHEKSLGPEHPNVGFSAANLGNVAMSERRYADARDHYERTRALWTKALGPDHDLVVLVSVDLGEALLGLGELAAALTLLEQGTAALAAREVDPIDLADARFALARALWDAPVDRGRDRVRARELAGLARAGHAAATGDKAAKQAAEVAAWLADHVE